MNNKIVLTLVAAGFLICLFAINLPAQIQLKSTPITNDTNRVNRINNEEEQYLRRSLKAIHNLISAGSYDQARGMLAGLERTYGNNDGIIAEKKNLYRSQKDFPALIELIKYDLDKKPDDIVLRCQLGEAYFLSDSLDLAKSVWEDAFSNSGQSEFNYMLIANYYRGCGFYDEAASVYTRARTLLNNPRIFSAELSDIYLSQRDYLKAVSENLNLIKQNDNPREAINISNLILNIYGQSDKPELIIAEIEHAVNADLDRPELHVVLGDIYVKNGQLKEAFDHYKSAEILAASNGFFLAKFVSLCYESGQDSMVIAAADYYYESIAKDKIAMFGDVGLLKAQSLAHLGSYQAAFDLLKAIEEEGRNNRSQADAIYLAGHIYANDLGDYKKAAAEYNRVVQTARGLPVAYNASLRLAEIDIRNRDFKKAMEKLEGITGSPTKNELKEQAEYLTAEILFFTDDFEKATKEYKRIAFQYTNGLYANDCLDRLALLTDAARDTLLTQVALAAWYRFAGQIDSALAILKEVSLQGRSKVYEYVLFYLPEYYALAGDWQTAINAYEHYLTSYGDGVYTDKALFGLAELYNNKAGRPDKADQLFNKLITEHPNSPLIEKARIYLNILKAS